MRFAIALLLLFIASFHPAVLLGQGVISGKVLSGGNVVAAATVSLLRAADSAWLRSELADDMGAFTFNELPAGSYMVSVSAVSYVAVMQQVAVIDKEATPCIISLIPQDKDLGEVTITGKKPFIEMGLGKLTVNVENAPTAAGASVLDLMRRLPGLTVGPDGSISMHGRQGVLVLIDDRPTYLSGDQLAEYLKTITADEIAQLELITQPGARYDAAGNTGVINIKMKKNKRQGFNGSVMASYAQSVYFSEHSSLLLNYKKDKLGITLTASDLQAKGFADWVEHQYYTDPATGRITATNDIHSTPWERFGITTARLSADYQLTPATSIGASLRGTYHPNTTQGYVSSVSNDANGPAYNEVVNPDGFIRKDAVANAFLSHRFSKESTLGINADYLAYGNYSRQDVNSTDHNSAMQPLPDPLILHSLQPSLINVMSLKADHAVGLANGLKLESGLKSSYVATDNNAMFTILQQGAWVNDTSRTEHFRYKENINAAYITAAKSLTTKWDARIGLRAEQTMASGLQYVHNNSFDRNYLSLFPTAFIGYRADSNNLFELNFGRRIDRPAYQQLNPFINYSFQYSYRVGNPYLLPQYTNSIELKHSYKNMLITAASLSATTDIITDILVLDNATSRIYSTTANNASRKLADCYVIFNKDVVKWWSVNASAYISYAVYSGISGSVSATRDGVGYSFQLSTQASCGKGWKVELNSNYSNDNIISLIETDGPQLYSALGVSKKAGERLLIRLLLNDPLYMYRYRVHNELGDFRSDAVFRNNTRHAVLELSYSFGSHRSQDQRRDNIEESKRMKLD